MLSIVVAPHCYMSWSGSSSSANRQALLGGGGGFYPWVDELAQQQLLAQGAPAVRLDLWYIWLSCLPQLTPACRYKLQTQT